MNKQKNIERIKSILARKQIDLTIEQEYLESMKSLREKEIEDTKEFLDPGGTRILRCPRLDELDEKDQ